MILSLHTATDICNVALYKDGNVIENRTRHPRAHAERLAPMIAELLEHSEGARLEGIVVAAGPGSYTGLRIGVSSAKGLAWALETEMFAVSTLQGFALAALEQDPSRPVIAIMKARTGEFNAGVYDTAGKTLQPDRVVESAQFPDWMEGVQATNPVLACPDPSILSGLRFEPDSVDIVQTETKARALFRPVLEFPDTVRVRDLSAFEPYYLKQFVAKKPAGSIFDRLSF